MSKLGSQVRETDHTRRSMLRWCLVSLLSGAGCRVGPDFVEPQPRALPSKFHQDDGSLHEAAANEQFRLQSWWECFNDRVLTALIADANRGNLGIEEAFSRITEARSRTRLAKTQFFPQFNATSGTSFRGSSENASQFGVTNGGEDGYSYFNGGFDSTWEIDLFGKLARGYEAAVADLGAQIAAFNDLRVTLVADVATAYIQARVLQRRILIAQENLKLQEQTLHIVSSRQESGLVGQLDRSEAESNVAVTSATIPLLLLELQTTLYRLCVLLGQVPNGSVDLAYGYGDLPTADSSVMSPGIPAELLMRRPDIRKARFDVMSSNAQVGVAVADRLPQLTIRGDISVESRDIDVLFTAGSLAHNVGPTFRWNILNFGRLKRNIEIREAQTEQALVRFQSAVLTALQDVETGLVEYRRRRERVGELGKVIEATRKSVEISLVRYEQNLITFDRVLDAQRSLAVAQSDYASAEGDVLLSMVRVFKALGGGW